MRRVLIAAAKLPMLADRRGLRWLLNGKVMPGGPLVILTHRGRRTGRRHSAVAEALVEHADRGEIFMTPMRGKRCDWYRNVVAAGVVDVRFRGRSVQARCRKVSTEEGYDVLARYRREHPVFARLVLWGMASGVDPGERVTAAAHKAELLALKIAD